MTRADFLSHPDRDAAGMRGWFEAYVSLEQTHGGKYRKGGRGRWRAPLGEATDRGAWWPPMALTPRRRERSTVSRTGDSPSSGVSIVAEGLKFEERGTGRLDYDKAALGGAVSGAPVGALLGFAFGLYGPVETFVSDLIMALWGLVFGGPHRSGRSGLRGGFARPRTREANTPPLTHYGPTATRSWPTRRSPRAPHVASPKPASAVTAEVPGHGLPSAP
jgi:hypothetical protein